MSALVLAVTTLSESNLASAGEGHAHDESCGHAGRGHGRSGRFAGMLYAMTNQDTENTIVRFGRRETGALVWLDERETGGVGSGNFILPRSEVFGEATDPILNAHGLTFSPKRDFLLAVNAGDDTVSVFEVKHDGRLHLRDRVESNGRIPVSIAIRGNLVYVANAGDFVTGEAPSLTGFRLRSSGRLTPISDSKRNFAPAVGMFPTSRITDVLFSPGGDSLVVANTFSDEIDVFEVADDGRLKGRKTVTSVAPNPFGMVFLNENVLAVTDANAIAGVGASSVSTYELSGTELRVISAAVPNGQTEACWLSVTPDGKNLYSANAPSFGVQGAAESSISHYSVNEDGSIELVAGAVDPRPSIPSIAQNAAPLESVISSDGRFYYQLWAGLGEVAAYRIESDGSLTLIEGGAGTGLPIFSAAALTGF